uniref:Low molecular weight antigen MTB12-like C-terminal domain-containing protein n=1 Tax=Streptomyces sp. NBC_00093 TaxID=2975649 RepID=A0AAU2ACA4_9ACTN
MVLGSDLRRGNARRGTAITAALVLFLGPALAACSDDDDGGGDSTTSTPSVSTEPTDTTEPTETSAEPTGDGPADPVAAEKEIRQNWVKFFDPAVSLKDKQAVLENGDKLGLLLQAFSGDQRGGQVEAKVDEVEFTSPTAANVSYALLLEGATALPNASGTAVEQDGTWKVTVNTLCALVGLSGNASTAPGC